MNVNKIKRQLLKRHSKRKLTEKDFVSTGSTMLNLACTDKPYRGFAKGYYYRIIGDSRSGKTFLALTCLAEAGVNKNFDNYRFIYDNGERGAMMDIARFFGEAVEQRMEPPAKDKKGNPIYSTTVEEFYYHLDDACKQDKPFIYIVDSESSLSSRKERKEFGESKMAHRGHKQISGSYGDGKAKINSAYLRLFINALQKSGSILIVISQTRSRYDGTGKAVAGGWALLFYAGLEIWSSVKEDIFKTIRGKKRLQGVLCKIRVKKNRITGKDRLITLPIYTSHGIDDIGSCVDYLISEKHWTKSGFNVIASEFDFEGKKEKLIQHIEREGMEKDLRELVGDVWSDIEKRSEVRRKKRYK